MRGHKGSEYEGGHRVPFFASWPRGGIGGGIGGGRDVGALSAHVDVLPTLAELCGLERTAPHPLDGVSLAAALRGTGEAPGGRILFVHSQRVEHPRMWRKCAVMTERWRLVNGNELYDVEADPGQERDVAAAHAEVVGDLRARYKGWWLSLEPALAGTVRIGLGGPEDPVRLMSHDWHTEDRGTPWHQDHVRNGYVGNGPWAVEVERAGEYEIRLFRWPEHLARPMEAVHASIAIGEVERAVEIEPSATSADFTVRLPAGPAELWTTLRRESGEEHGAYFASVRRLGD